MKFNMIICGVGGQGILSISYVVDNAAVEKGLRIKQSEVHGMAQRGGAVVSHLRISDDEIFSDLIPTSEADLILSMEPLESLRYLAYLSPGGSIVTSMNPFVNIPDYPDEAEVYAKIQEIRNHTLVNAAELARVCGSAFAQNMVMLGAAAYLIPLDAETLEQYIGRLFQAKGEKIINTNIKAFRAGARSGAFYRGLLGSGIEPADALAVAGALLPDGAAEDLVKGWIELSGREGFKNLCGWLKSRKGLVPMDGILGKLRDFDLVKATPDDFQAAIS
jgi:indolepyruvate ferredoxin oxidoreductase beta subunit